MKQQPSKKAYNFGETISPQPLQTIVKKPELVFDLLNWQREELKKFSKAVEKLGADDFVKHYRTKIKKSLDNEHLFSEFFERMKFYSRMEDSKIVSLVERSNMEHRKIQDEIKELSKKRELIMLIHETWDMKSRKKLSKRQGEKIREFFIEFHKMNCKHIATYCSFIYDSFFVVEYNCKYLCAMGCFRFAKNIAQSKTLGHSDVWKTLKNLSGRNKAAICDHCFTRKSCNFGKIFMHLSNLYASSIKLRMLSDYSEIFYHTEHRKNIYDTISNYIIPTIVEIHKFKELVTTKSKIMWSPLSDEDLGIL